VLPRRFGIVFSEQTFDDTGASGSNESVMAMQGERPRFTSNDRWFFVQMYQWFPSILEVATVIGDGNRGLVAAARRCLWTLGK